MIVIPVLILGTGPTLSEFNVGRFRGRCYVIAVNDAYKVCPWADMFYACDRSWWAVHGEAVALLQGEKVTLNWTDLETPYAGARAVRAVRGQVNGFSMNKDEIYSGRNSGYQALQIAAQMSGRAYLAGFDMGATGNTHFFGDHPSSLAVGSNYEWFVEDFSNNIQAIRSHCSVSLLTSPSGLSHLFNTITIKEAMYEL